MRRILILNPYYFPGFRSGGPQQTVMNIADTFAADNDIYILTQNHDMGSSENYDVATHQWVKVGNASVMYLPSRDFSIKSIQTISKSFDTVYACDLFQRSTIDAILIHKLGRNNVLYVAPMGVFSKGAISSKALKKRVFLFVFKHLGLFKNIIWSFTSEIECDEARLVLGDTIKDYIIAEDLPRKVDFEERLKQLAVKCEGENSPLKLVFISRISPKKNLEYCVDILNGIANSEIRFDVYGTIENKVYWEKCKKKLETLPANIHYRYCGEVNSADAIDTFGKYDAFLFPTKGENFGHVIYEALAAGCLPIISDKTPWQDLDSKGCGNVIELNDIKMFQKILAYWQKADANTILCAKRNAIEYAKEKYQNSVSSSGYKEIFRK